MAKKSANIAGGKGAPGQKAGSPNKTPYHEGPAGAGSISRSKFNKDDRDTPGGQKEPGKSRGPAGG